MPERQELQAGRDRGGLAEGSVDCQPAPVAAADSVAEQVQRPAFIALRQGEEYCLLCSKWATRAHCSSEKHAKQVWWFQRRAAPAPLVPASGSPRGAAAHVEIAAIPEPPEGCPAWYTWDAERWVWYCKVCWKNADEKHLASCRHLRRAAWARATGWQPWPQPPVAQPQPPLAQPPWEPPTPTPPRQERATLQTPEQQRPQPVWERVPTAVDEGRSFFRNTVSGETTRALPRGVRVFFEWF